LVSASSHHSITAGGRQSTYPVRIVRPPPYPLAFAARNGQHAGAMTDPVLYSFRGGRMTPVQVLLASISGNARWMRVGSEASNGRTDRAERAILGRLTG
jgi:hypothetical protein